MYNLETLFLFLNVLSILVVLKIISKFISTLLSNPPIKLILSNRELITFWISLAYTITYFIKI